MKKEDLKDACIVEVFDNFEFMRTGGENLHPKDSEFLGNMIMAVAADGIETINVDKDVNGKALKDKVNTAPLVVVRNRLEAIGYTVTDYCLIFTALLEVGDATALIYSAYFAYLAKEKGVKDITLELLTTNAFSNGIPSNDVLTKVWNGQKVTNHTGTNQCYRFMNPTDGGKRTTDNLLDFGECWRNLKWEENNGKG